MDHFVDIKIRPDPEFSPATLLNTVYGRLHMALVYGKIDCIGVSFPEALSKPRSLGIVLRLHGTRGALVDLMAKNWPAALDDHIMIAQPRQVPADARQYSVRRVQVKSSVERLRRRLAKRHNLSFEEARERIPDSAVRTLEVPFLQVRSASTSREFRIFIKQEPASEACTGTFNYYGLSRDATVPWF